MEEKQKEKKTVGKYPRQSFSVAKFTFLWYNRYNFI